MAIKVRRIDLSPDEWIAGTLGLTLEEEGLYIKICVLIWSAGGRITEEHLKRCTASHGNKVNAILERLEVAGKITRNGSEIGQKRAEKELENAQKRAGKARENGAKVGHHKGLAEPGGYDASRAPAKPSTSKEEGLSPKELNPVFLTAREASPPPLPSQGDGAVAARAEAGAPDAPPRDPEPTTVFNDPELKAYGVARLGEIIANLTGKPAPTPPPPPQTEPPHENPERAAFRKTLARLYVTVGQRGLPDDEQWNAWDVISRANAIGDPTQLPPDLADALQRLGGE